MIGRRRRRRCVSHFEIGFFAYEFSHEPFEVRNATEKILSDVRAYGGVVDEHVDNIQAFV
jgi:hypothetical protein